MNGFGYWVVCGNYEGNLEAIVEVLNGWLWYSYLYGGPDETFIVDDGRITRSCDLDGGALSGKWQRGNKFGGAKHDYAVYDARHYRVRVGLLRKYDKTHRPLGWPGTANHSDLRQ
jgi:hypothetical protein